jgi:TRAP transporter TAXI family solute receptor
MVRLFRLLMNSTVTLVLLGLTAGNFALTQGNPSALRITGGSPGSNVQVAAIGVATLAQEFSDSLRLTVLGTSGATENLRVVEQGEAEIGITASQAMYWSLQGSGPFENEEPYSEWRAVVPQSAVPLYGIVTERSGIKSWEDLQGKRVSLGPAGSGTGALYRLILPELDVTGNFVHLPWEEANQRIRGRQLDAHLMGIVRLPASIEAEAFLGDSARWIGVSDPEMQVKAMKILPAFSRMTIPPRQWENQAEEINTIGTLAWVIAHKDTSDEAVYELTRLIVEEGEEVLASYGGWTEVWRFNLIPSFDALLESGAKLHPGAARYFREQGYDVPEALLD